ncbi:4-(cytidine 5'-diphospho)-2-C-methyl-D-erythritol kinase [Luteolibacter ambystomatis]|uniref:4-diphosphocytidyl-2-C-methyl-D-erythritol kinase n=1 Tax=Luteolibacter ambystomatis TaxID=2824561 RepID=A0A975J2K4_9BACT|nr:4-(cytidine 5'-diphospho)-2-C-methyl-D-erythritol kinase [Luteolibacter ambystomatis]QUE52882.1 4-(cytidine 5'-diphospho)-2-C-methyl-D-erythritol kinase [Luteolibacter ambystomatis]
MIQVKAPAKLNLSLRILAKRDDGFHALDTLMIRLPELADVLTISEAEAFVFTCSDPTVPGDESNLVVKAVRAWEAASGRKAECSIHLEKHVPHGAGLGGGSSDAATALAVVNDLHGSLLPVERLIEIAGTFGSDIPFFLMPGAVRCTGRGEILEPAPSPPALPVLLLKPAFGVATPDAYKRWKDSLPLPGVRYDAQVFPWGELVNDLERPVFEKHRLLAEVKEWLLNRPEVAGALMSGSGSTMFAVLHDLTDARTVADEARMELDPGLWSWAGMTDGEE